MYKNDQGNPKPTIIDRVTRKSIIQIINFNYDVNDVRNKMCLPRAIEVAKAHFNRRLGSSEKKHYERIRKTDRYYYQIHHSELLLNRAGLPLRTNGYTLEDMDHFQRHLMVDKYAIIVYESNNIGNGEPPLFNGVEYYNRNDMDALENNDLKILKLLYIDSIKYFIRYYYVITNLTGLASLSYYCEKCNKTFSNK